MERMIAVLSDIKDISEFFAGWRINQLRLSPSGGRLQLDIELARPIPERRSGKRATATALRAHSHMTLTHIKEFTLLPGDPPDPTMLLACDAVPGGYLLTLATPEKGHAKLILEQLNGRFFEGNGAPVISAGAA